MSFKAKITEALETILEDVQTSTEAASIYQKTFTGPTTEDSSAQTIDELHSMICTLNAKMSILIDKVEELNENVVNVATLQEEMLYTFEQFEQREDNTPKLTVHSVEKKYGLN